MPVWEQSPFEWGALGAVPTGSGDLALLGALLEHDSQADDVLRFHQEAPWGQVLGALCLIEEAGFAVVFPSPVPDLF